jgi:hypothetical protein
MAEREESLAGSEFVASREVRTGYLSGPGFVDTPVRYSVVDGVAIFDGCIDMGPAEEVAARAERIRATRNTQESNGGSGPGSPGATIGADQAEPIEMKGVGLPPDSAFLWTDGIVPFVVDGTLPNAVRVTQAIAHLEANTGIRFVPRTNHANWVRFVRNSESWSSSAVGMRGGEQLIRVSDGAVMGTVVHECMHALGVLHEQSRCDRDTFVSINYANIQDGFESNFDRFCDGYRDYLDYDYGSIMHYPATAFSRNGQPTIVPVQSGVTIGQRAAMSVIDRLTIAEMYSRFTGRGHTGVWRARSGRQALWVNANWDSFRAKWEEWAKQGLRLIDVNVRVAGNETRYSGVWQEGTGGYGLWVNASWESFRAKWEEWAKQGLRLADMHVLRVGKEDRYSGVWLPGTGGYGLWVNASWDSFRAKWEEWAKQGLRLVDVNVQNVGGQTRYSGVWLPGAGGHGLWANASWESFRAKWEEWAKQGLRLVDVNVHQEAGDNRYTGVFLPGTDGYYLWANVPWESLRARWEQLGAQGLRLVDYEFTEPATADAGALDSAGTPAQHRTAEDIPVGAGGIVGESGRIEPSRAEANQIGADPTGPVTYADARTAAAAGQGGLATASATARAFDGDGSGGFGGLVAADAAVGAPATASANDGAGGAVFADRNRPATTDTSATPGGDGVGAAVGAGDGNEGASYRNGTSPNRGGLAMSRN